MNLIHSAPQGYENIFYFSLSHIPSFITGTCSSQQRFIFKLERERDEGREGGGEWEKEGERERGRRRETKEAAELINDNIKECGKLKVSYKVSNFSDWVY